MYHLIEKAVRFSIFPTMCFVLLCLLFDVASAQDDISQRGVSHLVESAEEHLLEPFRSKAHERWNSEIRKIEARDQAEVDPADAILFLGSSSGKTTSKEAILFF